MAIARAVGRPGGGDWGREGERERLAGYHVGIVENPNP
jgi:hypothetical protein